MARIAEHSGRGTFGVYQQSEVDTIFVKMMFLYGKPTHNDNGKFYDILSTIIPGCKYDSIRWFTEYVQWWEHDRKRVRPGSGAE